jgi:hypothetical protein
VSSLYRCRARVGYKPFKSSKLIVFDERQVQELSVDLKWQPGMATYNQDSTTTPTAATNFLNTSTCQVTISDPYLTGLAWPVLFDAASIYTASNIAAANNIILPSCTEGQDPVVDKCFKYVDLEADDKFTTGDNWALIQVSLWYDVAGTSFGTDFYFRMTGFSVSHGTRYPSVTMQGMEARAVLFNQSLINTSFDEGAEIEKVLKDLSEKMGYSVSWCANTNSEPEKKRLLPRSIRFKGVTPDEAIKKVIDSVGGNTLSLPTREYANKISMCTRGEVQQGCSVFYLGKGLYEGYEINGQPDLTFLALNLEQGSNRNEGDQYVSEAFNAASYTIQDIVPKRRKKALEKVKKVKFPKQFDTVSPHIKGVSRLSGFAWKDSKPVAGASGGGATVTNERLKDVNMFGIAPNGTTAISFLSGKVIEADTTTGRVVINAKFFIQICDTKNTKKCFVRQIRQETTGLSSVKVKAAEVVVISQEIGSSTEEKPEFTRFFIEGFNNERVTLGPQIVWDWAVPEEELKEIQPPASPVSSTGAVVPPAPATPTSASAPTSICFKMGSSGSSTGGHLHAEWRGPNKPINEVQVRKYVDVAGVVPGGGRFGDRGGKHAGVDISNDIGTQMCLKPGVSVKQVIKTDCPTKGFYGSNCGGSGFEGYGNSVIISTPEGDMLLAHLAKDGIPPNIAGMSSTSGGGKQSPNMQASPATQGLTLETSFGGVPRSLRIIPGRTVLSLISDYDSWVEKGGPRGNDNGTDPGIWIPGRFKNWFVSQCKYKWRDGDLRVDIEGRSAWGTQTIKVPTFPNYISSMRGAGELKNTNDYFGYIRSIGDLHWITERGKDSTEELCGEAQYWSQAVAQGPDTTSPPSPTSISSNLPQGKCSHPNATYNEIIKTMEASGMRTKQALAGVLGNMAKESLGNWNIHNTPNRGEGCQTTPSRVLGRVGYGLVQWCGSRADELATKYSCGRNCSFSQQLSFIRVELEREYKGMIGKMNAASTAGDAAAIFRKEYERPQAKDEADRRKLAEQIFSQISCR